MELWNFKFQILCTVARKKWKQKLFKRYSWYVFLQVGKESSRRRITLFLSLAESLSWMLNQFACSNAKRVKSLKYFVAKKDYWSDFISYALLIRLLLYSSMLLLLFDASFVPMLFFFEFVPFCLLHDFLIPLLHKIDTLAIHRLSSILLVVVEFFIFVALPLFHHFLAKYIA